MLTKPEKMLLTYARQLFLEQRLDETEARERLKIFAARDLGISDYRTAVNTAADRISAEAHRKGLRPTLPTQVAAPPPVKAADLHPIVPERIERPALIRETVGDRVYYGIAPTPPPPAGPPPAVLQAAKAAGDAFRRAVGRARNAPPPEPPPGPAPELRAKAGRFVRDLKRAETAQRQTR